MRFDFADLCDDRVRIFQAYGLVINFCTLYLWAQENTASHTVNNFDKVLNSKLFNNMYFNWTFAPRKNVVVHNPAQNDISLTRT